MREPSSFQERNENSTTIVTQGVYLVRMPKMALSNLNKKLNTKK